MTRKHGGDIYRRKVKLDLSVSVNPLGMPKASAEAAKAGVDLAGRYPDTECGNLVGAIAAHEKIDPAWIVPGNGAAELIYALTAAVKPKKTLVVTPGFYEYERAAETAGSELLRFPLFEENNFRIDPKELAEQGREADIVWICNPNNPTGYLIEDLPLIIRELGSSKKCPVIAVDECFLPFLENEEQQSARPVLGQFSNLVILRALTKFYGMPGLRVGYLESANAGLRAKVRAYLQPWNVSVPAQMAGAAAFSDPEYDRKTRELVKTEKAYLLGELKSLAGRVYGSDSNFIFFRADRDLKKQLMESGILIRSFEDDPALGEGYYRIGIRTHEENAAFVKAWRELPETYR